MPRFSTFVAFVKPICPGFTARSVWPSLRRSTSISTVEDRLVIAQQAYAGNAPEVPTLRSMFGVDQGVVRVWEFSSRDHIEGIAERYSLYMCAQCRVKDTTGRWSREDTVERANEDRPEHQENVVR